MGLSLRTNKYLLNSDCKSASLLAGIVKIKILLEVLVNVFGVNMYILFQQALSHKMVPSLVGMVKLFRIVSWKTIQNVIWADVTTNRHEGMSIAESSL